MTVDDLVHADLARLESWSSATHLKSVSAYLDQRDGDGDAEYLVVRDEIGVRHPITTAPNDETGADRGRTERRVASAANWGWNVKRLLSELT